MLGSEPRTCKQLAGALTDTQLRPGNHGPVVGQDSEHVMVPESPHASLQVSLSSFPNPGTADLGEEESKWWEKKINKTKQAI